MRMKRLQIIRFWCVKQILTLCVMVFATMSHSVYAQIVIDTDELVTSQTIEPQVGTPQVPIVSAIASPPTSHTPIASIVDNSSSVHTVYTPPSSAYVDYYYANMMNIQPYLPRDLSTTELGCSALPARNTQEYTSSNSVDYSSIYWEQRVKADWNFFATSAQLGKVLVIDFGMVTEQGQRQLGYRYLANQHTQDTLYEPWSSSKIFAYTGAIAKVRQLGIGAHAMVGTHSVAELITSINTYEPLPVNNPIDTIGDDRNSNAIATYFTNIAGRDYLTSLFHDRWLLLSNPLIRFRGAYGPVPYVPSAQSWLDLSTQTVLNVPTFTTAYADPGYQGYRCQSCGLSGNKPMTTLAQAEWLKRLATHDRDPLTRHPHLRNIDVSTLFYGAKAYANADQTGIIKPANATEPAGGMLQGISRMLHHALAEAMAGQAVNNPKQVLDDATQGQWRVFQKIGWGPSETRTTGENVVLAHVCLPHYQGGREFTIAAQTSHPDATDESVNHAGIKMQRMLTQAMIQLLQ